MLDNFEPKALSVAASSLKRRFGESKFLIEVSGGVTEDNIKDNIHEGPLRSISLNVTDKPQVSISSRRLLFIRACNTVTSRSSSSPKLPRSAMQTRMCSATV
jgi:hypothetical protein